MGLITFTSDFGEEDHYVPVMKSVMFSVFSDVQILDVSHRINPFDIAHGAFVVRSVFRNFPQGTVHLVAVDTDYAPMPRSLCLKIEDHFFVGPDNGVLSLVSTHEPTGMFLINETPGFESSGNRLGWAAAMLAKGTSPEKIGVPNAEYRRLLGRQLKSTKKQIAGNVIRIDHYGNLITNIEQEIFRILHQERSFVIKFGKETSARIHGKCTSVEPGECFIVFNSLGLLEIGINKGNAAELLGLGYDSPVQINFDDRG